MLFTLAFVIILIVLHYDNNVDMFLTMKLTYSHIHIIEYFLLF